MSSQASPTKLKCVQNSCFHAFDLLSLWPVLLDNQADPDRNAWAFGHALTEYWTQNLTTEQMAERFQSYL